jgi:predicted esterase
VDVTKTTPLAAFHGDADQVVHISFIRGALDTLKQAGVTGAAEKGVLRVYPGMSHSASGEELADLLAFVKQCLPPLPAAAAEKAQSEL